MWLKELQAVASGSQLFKHDTIENSCRILRLNENEELTVSKLDIAKRNAAREALQSNNERMVSC